MPESTAGTAATNTPLALETSSSILSSALSQDVEGSQLL